MNFEKPLAIFIYLSMFYILAATSVASSPPVNGPFLVSTDCTTPYSETDIVITTGAITSPGGSNFSDFGLPTTTFYGDNIYVGTIAGTNRTCHRIVGREGSWGREWAYSCKVEDAVACTVLLQAR